MDDFKLWDEFLKEWPVERVRKMTIEEYTKVGSKKTFAYWLEAKLDVYGSIWGGSSFKFGIYSRADQEEKESDNSRSYSKEYAWYTRAGNNEKEAFAEIKKNVLDVIDAVQKGDIEAIDKIPLGPAYKWKIAYHYQNRDKPLVIALFKHTMLAELCGERASDKLISTYHKTLIREKPESMNIHEYSRKLWKSYHSGIVNKGEYVPTNDIPLNSIFYGPPGTGKTYNTINQALKIICKSDLTLQNEIGNHLLVDDGNRELLEKHFYKLIDEKRISFLTFHPSYTYEDFIHGIRPLLDGSESVSYELKDGPFKKMAESARSEYGRKISSYTIPDTATIYKMSLGNSLLSEDDEIFDFCKDNGYIAHGFGGDVDFSFLNKINDKNKAKVEIEKLLEKGTYNEDRIDFASKVIWKFNNDIKKGDLVIISKGNTKIRAIGYVTGEYEFRPDEDIRYNHFRKVEWILDDTDIPVDVILNKQFSQQTLYTINKSFILWDNLKSHLEREGVSETPRNYVIIIDEINRGNIPRIFGELITLIETDKRLKYIDGKLQGLTVTLPGALEDDPPFGIPINLYIIGTMNTADRSITTLDLALRRRFSFLSMFPKYDTIDDDILRETLIKMNENIIQLKDKDHQIGHSYFINKEEVDLPDILNESILPLLEEYFFGDNEQIKNVFNGVEFQNGKLAINSSFLLRYVANES
jgi:5-methylcytosine-specific restriction protein B